ncbi:MULTISPECIES: hypothetical protein [Micrococcaceae]|uniref:hypothetical protein n=1 Tax=Micrococcaceae TaxID=1268 RepID=UPI0016174797|nr:MULTISPECIES: hypothetical protein [Micrococcaceae]MBB5748204.1 hypothetical protein [Micrococcus sp. TA1]HRO30626.1 hypothetical protein [Citricoccus sp.]HRO94587.1 hypothetical protein [Citricoccus sp.]
MSPLNRKIGATLAGTAFAASALLAGVPAATASTAGADGSSDGEWHYRVVFDYLDCHDNEDHKGYDEVYMKFGHHTVWGPEDMDEGDHYGFDGAWADVDHDFKLSLWDEDHGHHDDEDDYLGHVWIEKHDYDEGWQYATFDDHGAHYELKYKVVRYWD